MRILFLVPYPSAGASNRVRVEQFIPYLKSKGVITKVRPFVNRRFFAILYLPHLYLEKIFWFVLCTLNRFLDIIRALRYDIVFIHRETYPFGGPMFELILSRIGKPIIFDFDDAIFLPNTSRHNIYIERFKRPDKVRRIIQISAHVIVGNNYLMDYAMKYNRNVTVIPSSVDTAKYRPAETDNDKNQTVIGWIGSGTTRDFIFDLEDVFADLSRRYKNLTIKIIGGGFYSSKLNNVVNKRWILDEEVLDLRSFDIGIMPMPDNEWTKGKCGFKAILYMACGKPVVASPVGANTEIVDDGVNGFFARKKDEWLKRLSVLIDDGNLRKSMGEKGREKVVIKYSLDYAAPLLYSTLKKVSKNS